MDIVYLVAAVVVLAFGAWIAHSGLRRWQRRNQSAPMTAAVQAETSSNTDFRYRPHLETLMGLFMIAWALRLIVLFALQQFEPPSESVMQNSATGRMESLPMVVSSAT